jgi:hypothetical protein
MSSPEISTVNAVRFRVGRAEKDWREAVELVREAAALPGYRGPALEDLERVAAAMAAVRALVANWHLDEALLRDQRRAARPRPPRPAVKKLIHELAARG